MISYWLIFWSAFGAATLLPFYSEVLVVAAVQNKQSLTLVWAFATLGNTIGAAVNWLLGRFATRFREHRWFPFKPQQMERGEQWFQRYGVWSLLMAWLPIGGDALTFIAGVLRVNFFVFFILTGIGKGIRYAAVIAAANSI